MRTENFEELKDIEIFAPGKHRSFMPPWTSEDLDGIIESFKEIGHEIKPMLKLGHDDKQKLVQNSGLPAAGWMTDLRRVKDKLVADFKDVPKVVMDLVKHKAYKRISSELGGNFTHKESGKKFKWVLKNVALLGGDTPEVQTLQDVEALYAEQEAVGNGEKVTMDYENEWFEEIKTKPVKDKTEDTMSLEQELADARSKIVKLEEEKTDAVQTANDAEAAKVDAEAKTEEAETAKTEAEGKVEEADKKVEEAEKTAEEATEKVETAETAAEMAEAEAKVITMTEKGVRDGKVTPAMLPILQALAVSDKTKSSDDGVRVFSFTDADGKEDKMEYKSASELVEKFIEAAPQWHDFEEKSTTTDKETRKPADVEEYDDGAELHEKIVKFQEEHKDVPYDEAAKIVSAQEVDNG